MDEIEQQEEISEHEQKWLDIHIGFVFGNSPIQTFLYFLVSLILMANEYGEFIEFDSIYSTRIFLDSFVFYIAFIYLSKPLFLFVKYMITMAPHSEYKYGSIWHKFFLIRVLIINSIIYGFAAFYAHQYFFSFA